MKRLYTFCHPLSWDIHVTIAKTFNLLYVKSQMLRGLQQHCSQEAAYEHNLSCFTFHTVGIPHLQRYSILIDIDVVLLQRILQLVHHLYLKWVFKKIIN